MKSSSHVSSLSKYLDIIGEFSAGNNLTLFRGQPNIKRRLLPAVARNSSNIDSVSVEKDMLDMLHKYGANKLSNEHSGYWYLLSEAQHFGLKTRLLDWSSNPLVALWFACQNPGKQPHVYVLKADSLMDADLNTDPFEQTQTKVLHPKRCHPRVDAQNGWYTVHSSSNQTGNNGQRFVPLEEELAASGNLMEIPILPAVKEKLLDELDQCGVNERLIYPDLSGLCRHINKLFETSLSDDSSASNPYLDQKKKMSIKVVNNHQAFGGMTTARGHSESVSELNRREVSDGFQQYRHTYTRDFDFD